jgi:hypothetical protein
MEWSAAVDRVNAVCPASQVSGITGNGNGAIWATHLTQQQAVTTATYSIQAFEEAFQ